LVGFLKTHLYDVLLLLELENNVDVQPSIQNKKQLETKAKK